MNGQIFLKQENANKTDRELNYNSETNFPRRREALSQSSPHKFEAIKTMTQTKAKHTYDEEYSYKRESFSPIPQPPLPSQLRVSSTSLPSLHENCGNTKNETCRNELRSDLVSEGTCSGGEFNDSSSRTDVVENDSNNSCTAAPSILLSSSSLKLSSSSPSICCYTIASHSKAFSKQSTRSDTYKLKKNKSREENYLPSLFNKDSNAQLQYLNCSRSVTDIDSELTKIDKIKVSPPPVPPKPSRNKSNYGNKNKCHQTELNKNQGKNLLDKLYYNPTSFRRKLQKFEKQNTLIGKSKNNATRASYKDEESDERPEVLGCFSVGSNTNLDHGVRESGCVSNILSVSGSEKDYNIVHPTNTWNNYRNIYNNNDLNLVINRNSTVLSSDKLYKETDQETKCNSKILHFNKKKSFSDYPLSNNYKEITPSPPVVIRKLTPKLIKELSHKNNEISASRRSASDNILNVHRNLNPEHQLLSYNHIFDQNNVHENKNSSLRCVVSEINTENRLEADHQFINQQQLFKSLSDTNNSSHSKSFDIHGNFLSCLSSIDIQNTNSLSNGEEKCVTCECESCRKLYNTQSHEANKDVVENCFYFKIAHYYSNHSSGNELYKSSIENNNTDDVLNLPAQINSSDSLSSSLLSLNLSSSSGRDTIGSKQTPAIESFGYISESHDSGTFGKEFVMEKRRNTLDRWQRLAFGKRSPPITVSQERTKKSTEKSERLKELTELLRRNRSSPTPPPIPPPRKARHVGSASSSLEKADDIDLHCLSTQSDDILLMDQDEENCFPSVIISNKHEQNNDSAYSALKPNISLSSFETLLIANEMTQSSSNALKNIDNEISTKLSRPESRTVIGSYARKGIPFRSASFSQIDYSSGKYKGSTSINLKDRQRRGNTVDAIEGTDQFSSESKSESQQQANHDEHDSNENTIYISRKNTEIHPQLTCKEEQGVLCTSQVILEEDCAPLGNDFIDVDKSEKIELESCINGETMKSQLIKEPSEAFESNLATLVEEEIPLESPPDNFLQTATTCLIPVPVYECSAQEWNVGNMPHDWVNVGPDELDIFQETVCPNKGKYNSTPLETVPLISVSQHSSTQQEMNVDEFESRTSIHDANIANHETSLDRMEVKKRYSHDDIEVSNEKRSSLECSLQRLCSNAEDRKKIDKSKRRKGMYIENTDWVENSNVFNSAKLGLDISLANSDVPKTDQIRACSPVIYLNSPEKEDLPISISMYSSDMNTSESENFKPLIWNETHQRTTLCCQSSEERDDGILFAETSSKSKIFVGTESVSDNENDRNLVLPRDCSSSSPALSDHDFKRYSKRPLRGPYGQMLEAEMKKPNRMHFEEVLEELKDSDSSQVRHINYGRHDIRSKDDHSRPTLQYSNSFRLRKNSTHLPIPTHTRAASTPSQIENVDKNLNLAKSNILEKRYQSSLDNSTSPDKNNYVSAKGNSVKHAKSSSLVPFDKQKNQSIDGTKVHVNRTVSERNLPTNSSEKVKNASIMPSPELLAELLQGASEKLVSEQRYEMFADTRTHVVQEIFRNEQSYVESLQTVVLKYFKVLKMPENAGMIDSRTVDEIFFMVPDILAIHEKFLNELKSRLDSWEPQQKVGDAFIETFSKTEVLEVYTSFVNNCNRAKNAIRTTKQSRPSFARFLESTAREHKGKLTLDNLLIKPVQKFPNYEMLFTRLIKHTDQEHPDQKHLQEVLKLVHDILVHINCKEREILENGQREATLRELEGIIEGITELIAPDRQFLLFDLVSMPSGQGARKERGFFLFNDLLVITSIKRRSGTIRKPNTASCPGSVASTLDTNKYKFLTKVSLDNLDIIKSKDENLKKIMNEIEQLADDCNKLQQIAEVTATIKYPHQILEDVIRDLHRDVQRQLSERQSNDAQLNMLELTVNSPNGSQKLSIIFGKAEKRSQWEEMFNEAKQKLAATLERHPIPEFMTSIPIVKTRAGLQFTCAAPTLSEQKDVWVCNSDGYVGQVCVMSLLPEPNVTSCNGVCNARILCLTSVPAPTEKKKRSSLNDETTGQEFRKRSSPNFLANQSEKKKSNQPTTGSDIQLDSNSSSDDSESETNLHKDRALSPSPDFATTSHHHQVQDSNPEESDSNQSTMWLGTEDGYIHVYNCTDTIRIKKNKIKIQHASAVYSILYSDNRVFVSLANGDICVYLRDSGGWNTSSPLCISIGTVSSPVNKLLNVHGRLWCSMQGIIKVLDTKSLQVVNQIQISSDSKPITNMAVCNSYVWISIQNSAHIKCFHSNTHQLVTEVNLAPAVNKMLSNCDDIIRQHKAACLRVTSLLSCKDLIWIGTSAGVLLTIPAQGFEKGSPNIVPTGIPHGHTGHVRFLTFVESTPVKISCNDEVVSSDYKSRRSSKHNNPKSETSNILIISGGDGYEDFRNSGANSLSEIAGREDSTNHLLIWQI